MTIFEAILLGAVQGITEFLPVSSSGHLVLAHALVGATEVPLLFDVLLHIATLVAVVVVFAARIGELLAVCGRLVLRRTTAEDQPLLRLIGMIVVATLITGVIGVAFKGLIEVRSPRLTSALFLVTAVLLVIGSRFGGVVPLEAVGWRRTITVAVAQGFGVLPGISRSGSTISVGLIAGLERRAAGEFSFLLSIPAILGALVLELRNVSALGASVTPVALVAGFLSAALFGLAALKVLMAVVRSGRLHWFALYLIPLGVWGLVRF